MPFHLCLGEPGKKVESWRSIASSLGVNAGGWTGLLLALTLDASTATD